MKATPFPDKVKSQPDNSLRQKPPSFLPPTPQPLPPPLLLPPPVFISSLCFSLKAAGSVVSHQQLCFAHPHPFHRRSPTAQSFRCRRSATPQRQIPLIKIQIPSFDPGKRRSRKVPGANTSPPNHPSLCQASWASLGLEAHTRFNPYHGLETWGKSCRSTPGLGRKEQTQYLNTI